MLRQIKEKTKAAFRKAVRGLKKASRESRRAIEAEKLEARVTAAIQQGTFEAIADEAREADPGPAVPAETRHRPPRGRPLWYYPGPDRYPAEALGRR